MSGGGKQPRGQLSCLIPLTKARPKVHINSLGRRIAIWHIVGVWIGAWPIAAASGFALVGSDSIVTAIGLGGVLDVTLRKSSVMTEAVWDVVWVWHWIHLPAATLLHASLWSHPKPSAVNPLVIGHGRTGCHWVLHRLYHWHCVELEVLVWLCHTFHASHADTCIGPFLSNGEVVAALHITALKVAILNVGVFHSEEPVWMVVRALRVRHIVALIEHSTNCGCLCVHSWCLLSSHCVEVEVIVGVCDAQLAPHTNSSILPSQVNGEVVAISSILALLIAAIQVEVFLTEEPVIVLVGTLGVCLIQIIANTWCRCGCGCGGVCCHCVEVEVIVWVCDAQLAPHTNSSILTSQVNGEVVAVSGGVAFVVAAFQVEVFLAEEPVVVLEGTLGVSLVQHIPCLGSQGWQQAASNQHESQRLWHLAILFLTTL